MKTFLMTPQETNNEKLICTLQSLYSDLNIYTASTNDEMELLLETTTYDLAIIHSTANAAALSTELIAKLSIPILVYTETNYIPYIKMLYGLGVSGVLNVDSSKQELSKAVSDVLANRIYMSETLKGSLLHNMVTDGAEEDDSISSEAPSSDFSFSETIYHAPLLFVDGRLKIFTEWLN